MTFGFYAGWMDNITEGDTDIVLGYPGTAAGTRVSAVRARHATVATACWAGTSRARAVLRVKVHRVHGRVLTGGRGVTALVWVSPTRPTVPGTTQPTWKGTLGNQDAYYC